MSIYERQIKFEIQNQKVDKVWRFEYQAVDRLGKDRGPSAISGSRQSKSAEQTVWINRAQTVRSPCADHPRQADKSGRGSHSVTFNGCLSLTPHAKRWLLSIVRGRWSELAHRLSGRLLGVSQPCLHPSISKSHGLYLIYSNLGILRIFSLI
jgi:hypothetical protein